MKTQIVLKNINVVDVEHDDIKKNVNVTIENDRINEIRKSTQDKLPNYKIIDCTGTYAVPGLFECHAHLSIISTFENKEKEEILEQFVQKGITQVRDVGGPLLILKKLNEEIHSGKLIGPEIFYAGPMLERSPLTWEDHNKKLPSFTVSIDTKKDVDNIISELQQNDASLIKTFSKFNPEIYQYLVDQAVKIDLPVTHDPGGPLFNSIPIDSAIDLDITCIEHGKAPWPAVLKDNLQQEHDTLCSTKSEPDKYKALAIKIFSLGIDSISIEKLHDLADRMVEKDVYICPTLSVFSEKPEGKDKKVSEIISTLNMMSSFFTQELIKRDVKILIGIDSCFPNTFHEMKMLKNLGLSEKDIIKGATKYPADWLRISDTYGSIEPNKKANILIVNDDPLLAIENLEKIHLVIKDGNIVYREQ